MLARHRRRYNFESHRFRGSILVLLFHHRRTPESMSYAGDLECPTPMLDESTELDGEPLRSAGGL